MFTQNLCMVQQCKNLALSSFDSEGHIICSKNYCLDHTPNPGKAKDEIYKYILENETIVGLDACGLIFGNIDFSNKKFFGCNFSHCTFQNMHSQNVTLKMCFFDFAVFNDCSFIKNNTQFTSFSGSTFIHTLFTSSDMIQDNFNGSKCFQSSFDDSDLFNSRFIKANLVDTSFRNCNLKKTNFKTSYRSNVSFKMSNTREAIFEILEGQTDEIGKNDYGNSIVDRGK